MPFKVFTNGVPLPASDLNDYLMEQAIATFPDSASRAAQLSAPVEGQLTYLADTDLHQYWSGSAWVNFGASQTLISTTTLTGASVTISSIPQTYNDLKLVIRNYRPSVDANLWLRVNGLSTLIYGTSTITAGAGDAQWTLLGVSQDNGANSYMWGQVNLWDYANTATWKFANSQTGVNNGSTPANTTQSAETRLGAQLTSAITSLTLLPSTGNFTSGTALLYGVR